MRLIEKTMISVWNRIRERIRWIPRNIRIKYYKNRFKSCGDGLYIFGKVFINNPGNIVVGSNCRLNEGSKLICSAESTIILGDDVTLSQGASVISTGYDIRKWMCERDKKHLSCSNMIGDNVWLCTGAIVLPGVKITGPNVIIAAGAVVTKDILDSNCLYAGVPARKIKEYDFTN